MLEIVVSFYFFNLPHKYTFFYGDTFLSIKINIFIKSTQKLLNLVILSFGMAEKILCRVIVEVVGKPKEHVEKAIQVVLEKAEEIEGLKIETKHIEEIKEVDSEKLAGAEKKISENAGTLFSSFVEIDFWAKDVDVVASFCFDFLPSSLEILEPERLNVDPQDISKLMNDMLSRLHNADLKLKAYSVENNMLKNNASLLLRNMIMVSVGAKPQTLEKLSESVGIPKDQLGPFLKPLIEQNHVLKEKDMYKLKK